MSTARQDAIALVAVAILVIVFTIVMANMPPQDVTPNVNPIQCRQLSYRELPHDSVIVTLRCKRPAQEG